MLRDSTIIATLAVNDIEQAKLFYGGTLGLEQVDENPGGVMYSAGGGRLFVYESVTAGSGEATSASFKVDDVPAAVEELADKGITFEHYDLPGATLEGDVHSWGDMQSSWFKDPDGNILCVANA